MKYRIITLILAAALGCQPSENPLVGKDDLAIALDDNAPELMTSVQVPGIAVAVVRDDEIHTWARGFANADATQPVTADTVFEAASLGKPVFAVAVIRLVEEGVIDLDSPLGNYMPQPYFDDVRAARMTPRMILSHRSGLPNWRTPGEKLALMYEPDTRFSYSGEAYVYLQRALETATGEPLQSIVSRLVFEPYGMSASSFVWRDEYDATKAWGHDDAGVVQDRRRPKEALAAASLHTSANDLGKFLRGILGHRGLTRSSVGLLFEPASPVPSGCVVCPPQRDPGPDSPDIFWSLGFGLLQRPGHRYLWHWGDNGDFKSYLFADDQTHQGVVVLTNGAGGLAIAGDIATAAIDDANANRPLEWLGYERWDSVQKRAFHEILRGGPARVASLDPDVFDEKALNALGYALMRNDKYRSAIEVFRTATARAPDSWNAWDSLGEALAMTGQRSKAIDAYQKSLEKRPDSPNAVTMLERLRKGIAIPRNWLEELAGTYDMGDDLVVLRLDADGLVADSSEAKNVRLIAIRPDRFIGADADVAYVIGEGGTIRKIADGKITNGKRR